MQRYDRVVIVGVGLLGGSIGLGLRARGLAGHVVGYGRRPTGLQEALQRGAVDSVETDLAAACHDADLALICTPVQQVVPHVEQCRRYLRAGGLITDVGSTKRGICDALAGSAGDCFCGSHPLAGSDKSGVAFAEADLFVERLVIVTPGESTSSELTARTEQLWQLLGSRTSRMGPDEHDQALARTSHLPHIVAAALAAATPASLLPLVAAGWCDTTRIAGGSPELWRQILDENRQPILEALVDYWGSLAEWIKALEQNDTQRVEQLLAAGKSRRDAVE